MVGFIIKYLLVRGVSGEMSLFVANIAAFLAVMLISILLYTIIRKVLMKTLEAHIFRNKVKWADYLIKNKVLERTVRVVPAIIIYSFAHEFPAYQIWIERITFSYIILAVVMALNKLLDAIGDIYGIYEESKARPIKGYLQMIKIISYAIGCIVIVAVIIGQSPWFLLSGIGAVTAILLLIFQNSILGFVAGIQLSANNMVRLGDWIEMQKYGINGDVVEISLHTVKVQNWDKTIATIPTHVLVSESFKNWRGMQQSGGRRIKRAIYIDVTSIRFCDQAMLEKFEKIQYIHDYIKNKSADIEAYNQRMNVDPANGVNGRRLTNIGTFRAYVEEYIKNHPGIHTGMIRMVRQLEPAERGLPIEIYAFANVTEWVKYENIQGDIFDHIFAVLPEFDLRIFQNPSGYDMRNWTRQ